MRLRRASGGCLELLWLGTRTDRDRARLHALGQIAHKIDVQKAVLEIGALHLDVVGELEAALEGTRGDAAMQEIALLAVGLLLPLTTSVVSFTSILNSSL